MSRRATVGNPTQRFTGVGLHGGRESWFEVHPAPIPGQGIIFRSYSTGAEVSASVDHVVSTNRSTCLGADGIRIDTVEHLLSACYALGVTDATVLFEGSEMPIGDGSALPFFELLETAGVIAFEVELQELKIDRDVVVADRSGAVLTAVPSESFWVTAIVDYSDYSAIGVQAATYTGEDYKRTVSPARTYGFHHELDALRAAGLGLGASFENVVALGANGEADTQTPLRMQDELVRHKILDLIGDLSLSQREIKVGIVALRPSHTLNVRLSRKLLGIGDSSGVI